jgi:prepilin-type N-terminal cleavage/methylation domain-containing protein
MIHFKNHNSKIFCNGIPNLNKIQIGVNGFTLIEVIMALAITALVLTPIFILHGTILQRVNRGSIAFDMILYCKELLVEARQKQDPDAQEFTLDKSHAEFGATCKYALDKTVHQKSSFASLPGLHKESVTVNWTEQEQKKQERLVTFMYKKPEQKKS